MEETKKSESLLNKGDFMRKISTLMLAILLAGCVSLSTQENTAMATKRKFLNLEKITVGMTQEEVVNLLGKEIRVGYKGNKSLSENPQPIFLNNPFRAETLKINNKTYNVMYYLTEIKNDDGIVSDDELTPFVFENNKLVGKNWDFLFELKKK